MSELVRANAQIFVAGCMGLSGAVLGAETVLFVQPDKINSLSPDVLGSTIGIVTLSFVFLIREGLRGKFANSKSFLFRQR